MLRLLIGLAAIALPAIAKEVHPCHGVSTGWGMHLQTCRQFWRCEEHPPTVGSCRDNEYFDVANQRCVAEENRHCFRCPPFGHTLFSVPRACHQFIRCWNGEAVLNSCPKGLVFDGRRGVRQCNWPSNDGCHSSGWHHDNDVDDNVNYVCPSVVERNGLPLFLRGRGTCDHYFVCFAPNRRPIHGRCPYGLHFNLREGVCDHPSTVNCDEVR